MRDDWTNQFKGFSDGHLPSLVSIKERLDPSLTIWKLACCVGQMLFFAENADDWHLLCYWIQTVIETECLRVSGVYELGP